MREVATIGIILTLCLLRCKAQDTACSTVEYSQTEYGVSKGEGKPRDHCLNSLMFKDTSGKKYCLASKPDPNKKKMEIKCTDSVTPPPKTTETSTTASSTTKKLSKVELKKIILTLTSMVSLIHDVTEKIESITDKIESILSSNRILHELQMIEEQNEPLSSNRILQELQMIEEQNEPLKCSSFIEIITNFSLVADNEKDLENIKTLAKNIKESTVDTCDTSEINELEVLRSSLANMLIRLAERIADLKERMDAVADSCFPSDWRACPPAQNVKVTSTPDGKTTKEDFNKCWIYCKDLHAEPDTSCYAWSFDKSSSTDNCFIFNSFPICYEAASVKDWVSGTTCG